MKDSWELREENSLNKWVCGIRTWEKSRRLMLSVHSAWSAVYKYQNIWIGPDTVFAHKHRWRQRNLNIDTDGYASSFQLPKVAIIKSLLQMKKLKTTPLRNLTKLFLTAKRQRSQFTSPILTHKYVPSDTSWVLKCFFEER